MFTINYSPSLIPKFRAAAALQEQPFVLIDVGCSGGIDKMWRSWQPNLIAHGFDPQQSEVARLQSGEENHHVHYWAYWVGLPPSHPFHQMKRDQDPLWDKYHNHTFWSRSSMNHAIELQTDVPQQSNSILENETTARISLTEFVRRHHVDSVDFIKIDADGGDLEVLWSCEEMLRSHDVLGLMIESPLTGTHAQTDNSFHNIDRLMRKHGFCLYGLSTNRYSRRDLPAPFQYDIVAQSVEGQTLWGDAIYFRDGASNVYREVWGEPLSVPKTLKLAGLYDSFGYPDCAAELLNCHRETLQSLFNVDELLDSLVPPFLGKTYSYREYRRLFENHTNAFFPKVYNNPTETAKLAPPQSIESPVPQPPQQQQRPFWRRAAGKVWRTLRRAG